MNVTDFLNANAYPVTGQNARCKFLNKGSDVTVAAATLEYNFFAAPLANPIASNFQIPFSGDNVFFVKKLAMYSDVLDTTVTGVIYAALMQSFLEIWINDRQQFKISLIKLLNFGWQNIGIAPAPLAQFYQGFEKREKVFVNPIIINSTANMRFRLHLNAAAATALDTKHLKLVMWGFQFDKLQQFEYNELQDNQFQRLDFDMYDIVPNVVAVNTYQFFANGNKSEELFSKILPLSESETFQVESMRVVFTDHNTVAPEQSLWFTRRENLLTVTLNDVLYWNSYISKSLCYYGDYLTALVNNRLSLWQNDVLETPILIPAKSNNQVTLLQPASVTPVVDSLIMLSFDGEITRRVA